MIESKKELKQIETMLREIRETNTLGYGPDFPNAPALKAEAVYAIIQRYSLPELHAFVRGMLYGL